MGIDHRDTRRASRSEGGAGIKAEPADPQQCAAIMSRATLWGTTASPAKILALADHAGGDQAGDPGIDMDNRAAAKSSTPASARKPPAPTPWGDRRHRPAPATAKKQHRAENFIRSAGPPRMMTA